MFAEISENYKILEVHVGLQKQFGEDCVCWFFSIFHFYEFTKHIICKYSDFSKALDFIKAKSKLVLRTVNPCL